MDDIERYLEQVCCSIKGSDFLRQHIREEIKVHLMEAVDKFTADGLPENEAVAKALEEFGSPEMVSEGLQAVYGRRVVAMLVEKAMEWKEKNMKTGWKWSFVTCSALVMLITVGLIFIISCLSFILPYLQMEYDMLDEKLPYYSNLITSSIIWLVDMWYVWMPLPVAAWVIFEWKTEAKTSPLSD